MSQRKYFGTDGVRGEVGGDVINAEFALRLGYAAGKVLAKEHSARRGRHASSAKVRTGTGWVTRMSLRGGRSGRLAQGRLPGQASGARSPARHTRPARARARVPTPAEGPQRGGRPPGRAQPSAPSPIRAIDPSRRRAGAPSFARLGEDRCDAGAAAHLRGRAGSRARTHRSRTGERDGECSRTCLARGFYCGPAELALRLCISRSDAAPAG